ncbi:GspE/PulE family protein [Neiella litorisoli]|uniref:GspE/PulE family protein n=1 Tax=Neiella litorisoli TaxID=2771431 RepID=UPI001CD109CC|nr:GspE/PulE family protein [Neiella litorisoli]
MTTKFYLESKRFEQELAELLVAAEGLDSAAVASARSSAEDLDITLAAALLRLGLCGEDRLFELIANVTGWHLINQANKCPQAHQILAACNCLGLSVDWCIDHNVFPALVDEQFELYLNEPLASFALEAVYALVPFDATVHFLLTPAMAAMVADDISRERAVSELFGQGSKDLAALAEEAPVINLVNSIVERAVQADSSDIHIESNEHNMVVRFRVDGRMREFMQQPSARFAAVASRIKLLSQLDIAERRLPQDGRFTTRVAGKAYDVRVSTAPSVHGESIVLRLLPKQRDELSIDSLGFEPDHLALMREWGQLSNGIVLVTGPTGSGKSTTLYGLLADVNSGEEKIVTVEDPVEFQLDGITQVQARPDIGYTFAKALRTFLRQDPDIIMVGEIRDKETADIAVQSSLTGHLVLSTLHTNDACSVFPRLTDIGVEPFMVAATIQGVQAQRLVRKLCPHCSEPTEQPELPELNVQLQHSDWRKPVGCHHCHGRGYRGRMGIYELVPVDSELRQCITSGATLSEIRQKARQQGYRALLDDGIVKASRGITTVEEVLRVCVDEDSN